MMQRIRHIILAVSAGLMVLPAGVAMADQKIESPLDTLKSEISLTRTNQSPQLYAQSFDRTESRAERRISASQAKSAAQGRYPGAKFVNVQMSGRDTYRVRLQQKNGQIVDVYVDARTGRVKN